MKPPRLLLLLLFVLILGLSGVVLFQGHVLTQSSNHPVILPESGDLLELELTGVAGRKTRAYLLVASGDESFILAHGNSSDGLSMLPRARWLVSLGYSVLVPDLQAHGETPGERKSFGWREAEDIAASYHYLKTQLGSTWIGGIGSSLGGASMLKASASGNRFDALILESVYADIQSAVRNRLELAFGGLGPVLEPLLTWQLPLWCGLSKSDLQPALWAREVRCDALVLVGEEDRRAKPWESEAIFANLATTRKKLLKMKGAGHVDLFAHDQANYAEILLNFLQPASTRLTP